MSDNRRPFCPDCLSQDVRTDKGYMICDECGYGGYYWEDHYKARREVKRLIDEARAAERERCARIAEPDVNRGGNKGIWRKRRMEIAQKIRELRCRCS